MTQITNPAVVPMPHEGYSVGTGISSRARFAAAIACGVIFGHFAFVNATIGRQPRDLGQIWFAARMILAGLDPYQLVGPGRVFEWPAPLVYPLPAAVLVLPLAPFPAPYAAAVFVFGGVAALVWALTRERWGPLLGILSPSVLFASEVAQWSPLLTASVALPVLGVALACKPTIGAALFVARPSRWAVFGGLALLTLALVLQPLWPMHWRDALARNAAMVPPAAPYQAPATLPGGFLALLCLLRWRRPEARLVAALACVPQTMLLYETVPLLLVPKRWWEAAILVLASWGLWYWFRTYPPPGLYYQRLHVMGTAIVWGLYLPATLLVLRRPNE